MPNKNCFPRIDTRFNSKLGATTQILYQQIIQETLEKILPEFIFSSSTGHSGVNREKLELLLPLITSAVSGEGPWDLSFFMLSKSRLNVFKFFFEMISRWLVPGEQLNVTMVYAVDFKMAEISDELYTLCEVMVCVEREELLNLLLKNLPAIQTEIKLGLTSSYFARKILEGKGIPLDEKIVAIQDRIATIMYRLPKVFNIDLLAAMQNTLLLCCNEFKMARTTRHLSKIIAIHHLFRKSLVEAIKRFPSKRHFYFKSFASYQQVGLDIFPVLSLLIGVNFIRDKEVIEEKHILQAVQECIPNAQLVENAFFVNRHGLEPFALFYLEINKADHERLTQEEIALLRERLPRAMIERIQHLVHPVFMPRNEEEIMRNIISLSGEIKSAADLPQVFITFDEQTNADLCFTVLMVRIMPPGGQTIEEKFRRVHPHITFIHDRIKMVGLLRKKQTKEATVFRLKIPKEPFLRLDHSLDLYTARQEITQLLFTAVGEFRDFNGGMIRQQTALLDDLKELLVGGVKYSKLLLETFFFSLTPAIMQTTLEAEALKTLFLMLLNAIESGFPNNSCFRIRQDLNFIFLLIKVEKPLEIEELNGIFASISMAPTELGQTSVKVDDMRYNGYIYRCKEPTKQQAFLQAVEASLAKHRGVAF